MSLTRRLFLRTTAAVSMGAGVSATAAMLESSPATAAPFGGVCATTGGLARLARRVCRLGKIQGRPGVASR